MDTILSNNNDSLFDYLNVYISNSYLWHSRLGHINTNKMTRMSKSRLMPKINTNDFEKCVEGKLSCKSLTKHQHSFELLEITH